MHDFIRSPVALVAAASTLLIVAAAMGAGLIAPYDSNDPASANVIDASVPLSEMFGYATDLRSRTQGRATYSMEFDRYDPVPRQISEAIIAKYRGA